MYAAERRAEEVLRGVPEWLWDGRTLPVPVEDIVDSHFGLLVRDEDDLRSAPGVPDELRARELSGLLLPGRREVWVNRSEALEWPPRRRFTIAHELGHWCLHKSKDKAVYCRADAVAEGDGHPPPGIEEEANVFAAALLMPAQLIRERYQRDVDFWGLCEQFATSGAAMGRRLHTVIGASPS